MRPRAPASLTSSGSMPRSPGNVPAIVAAIPSTVSCGGVRTLSAALDRMAGPLPGADAPVDDVDDPLGAVARQQARRDGAALAGGADRGHRPPRIDLVWQ